MITTAAEQKFARFLASGFDVMVDGLPRLLRQLKPDGPTGLLLSHQRSIDGVAARRNVLDGEREVASVARMERRG